MRWWIIGIAALGLAACDAVEPQAPDAAASEAATEIDPSQVTLEGDRLTAGAESFYFNAGQAEVEAALARALGAQDDSMELSECGAGPMVASTYPGGFTVNFQDGQLVGWFLRDGADNIALASGSGIGAAREEIEMLEGFAMVEDSTLGEEFYSESAGIGGFFDDNGAVSELYAGTQCFFR
ncbi:MAG: aspartate-semialdehyde dehydrogenase [Erythrobacter sp.]